MEGKRVIKTVSTLINTRITARLLILILMAVLASACLRQASRPSTLPTPSGPRVLVEQVRVVDSEGIYVTGQGTLPAGECIQTELRVNGEAASWWPADVCIQPDAGRWEILVPLGRNGAPADLSKDSQYEIRAWWPDQPEEVVSRFPFDLTGPKTPEEGQ